MVALGKLGGAELNVSSDVDLVFLYGGEGDTAGPHAVSHHEFFATAARTLIALLAEPTAEGQAFRVDMRLRPFGDSGPLVTSLPGLEDYFIGHARPWERYAWMKARVVAGPAEGVHERVQPFVYRRYLDYGMLDALRDMHGRIAESARQRRKADDIKVGAGGIREIEFAAQVFQMVRGGRTRGCAPLAARGLPDRGARPARPKRAVRPSRGVHVPAPARASAATTTTATQRCRAIPSTIRDRAARTLRYEASRGAPCATASGAGFGALRVATRARARRLLDPLFDPSTPDPEALPKRWPLGITEPQRARACSSNALTPLARSGVGRARWRPPAFVVAQPQPRRVRGRAERLIALL